MARKIGSKDKQPRKRTLGQKIQTGVGLGLLVGGVGLELGTRHFNNKMLAIDALKQAGKHEEAYQELKALPKFMQKMRKTNVTTAVRSGRFPVAAKKADRSKFLQSYRRDTGLEALNEKRLAAKKHTKIGGDNYGQVNSRADKVYKQKTADLKAKVAQVGDRRKHILFHIGD